MSTQLAEKSFHVRHRNLATGTNASGQFIYSIVGLANIHTCQPSLPRSTAGGSSSRFHPSSTQRPALPAAVLPRRKRTFQNSSPFARRGCRKLIKMNVAAALPKTRRKHGSLGAFQTANLSPLHQERLSVDNKIGVRPLLSRNSERSERKGCGASTSDVVTLEDQAIVIEKPEPKALAESDGVVRKARGVLSDNGASQDPPEPTDPERYGPSTDDPEIYDLLVDSWCRLRQAWKILEDTLEAAILDPRLESRMLLEDTFFHVYYQHPDDDEYECLPWSLVTSDDTGRLYQEDGDGEPPHVASWPSVGRYGKPVVDGGGTSVSPNERTPGPRHRRLLVAMPSMAVQQTCAADTFRLQEWGSASFYGDSGFQAADSGRTNRGSEQEGGSSYERSAAAGCNLFRVLVKELPRKALRSRRTLRPSRRRRRPPA